MMEKVSGCGCPASICRPFEYLKKSPCCRMIRRLFCLVMIFALLANQGLSLAHAHFGFDIGGQGDHNVRPHVHVGDHVHHEAAHRHDHSDHSHLNYSAGVPNPSERGTGWLPTLAPPAQHDADAVYCGESVFIACHGKAPQNLLEMEAPPVATLPTGIQNVGLRSYFPLDGQPPTAIAASCPIYLGTLSLRL